MRLAVLALLAAIVAAAPASAEECHLQRAATLPLRFLPTGRIAVPVSVGGRKLDFLVDSGGVDSMLGVSTVKALNLPIVNLRYTSTQMFGGEVFDQVAVASNVDVGGLKADQMRFLIMPDIGLETGTGGLLAPDVMRAYDDDFDFANATFNLVSPDHCPGQVVYWTKDYSAIDFQLDDTGHIMLIVSLDGAKFRATVDTGASRSVLGLSEAEILFHIDKSQMKDMGDVEGVGHAYTLPFAALTMGTVTVQHPDILLVPESDSRMTGALIGIGVLRQLHLYIAYREQKIYVSAATAH